MIIFHVGVKEKPRKCSYTGNTKGKRNASNWKLWFKESEFYKVYVMYATSVYLCCPQFPTTSL